MIEITVENPDQAEVHALLAASDAYMASLYPAESNHMVDVSTLRQPHVTFLVARAEGRAVGCGAVVKSADGWAEIKRMFVSPAARGRRVGGSDVQPPVSPPLGPTPGVSHGPAELQTSIRGVVLISGAARRAMASPCKVLAYVSFNAAPPGTGLKNGR